MKTCLQKCEYVLLNLFKVVNVVFNVAVKSVKTIVQTQLEIKREWAFLFSFLAQQTCQHNPNNCLVTSKYDIFQGQENMIRKFNEI